MSMLHSPKFTELPLSILLKIKKKKHNFNDVYNVPHIHSNHPVVITEGFQLISPRIPKLQSLRLS